jgi:hypothetical protein
MFRYSFVKSHAVDTLNLMLLHANVVSYTAGFFSGFSLGSVFAEKIEFS